MGIEEAFDPGDKIALQLLFAGKPFGPDTRLALSTGLPIGLISFVAADMDVGGWEKRHHLGEHPFQEGKSLFLARTVDMRNGPHPAGRDAKGFAAAG